MSMKRTWPISNSISFLISAGIQEVTLHYASFINLLLVQVSRGKAGDYRTILRKYVVKLPVPAKRQLFRFAVFAQNYAVRLSEIVRKILAIVSVVPTGRVFGSADDSEANRTSGRAGAVQEWAAR